MSDFEVKADDFVRLSKALKDAGHGGRGGLRAELNKGIRGAVKPAQKDAAAALEAAMPSGLRGHGKNVKQTTQVRTGRDPGVTVGVAYGRKNKRGLGYSNARLVNRRGAVRHPVFGDRSVWRETKVGGSGWFDRSYNSSAPGIRKGIEQAMETVAEEVVRRARG